MLTLGLPGVLGVLAALAVTAASIVATGHAVLHKRDERAAIGWVAVIWLAPGVGVLLYVMLGINRIRRRAARLREGVVATDAEGGWLAGSAASVPAGRQEAAPELGSLGGLDRLMDRVCRFPRVHGNRIEPLVDGTEAYPAMWQAIEGAERSVALMTYIFDRDPSGAEFVARLQAAVQRGVQVRVLVDDAGIRYSFPTIVRSLRAAGIPHGQFLKTVLWRAPYFNLRTHRKVLVVDGKLGFTGGINIRHGHRVDLNPRHPVRDLHFSVQGPLVTQLMKVFAEDWKFSTGEVLDGDLWVPEVEPAGDIVARTVTDGPDEDLDQLRWAYLGALASAQHSVRIVTPYFLPDAALQTALVVAAHRGIEVDVLLPSRSNLPFVQWAMWGQLPQLVDAVRIWLSPPPFDHTKLLVVDERWVLFGSGNWDPRSLRLNFELDVEAVDDAFGARMARWVDERLARARRLELSELEARSLPIRLRDGLARLLSPYL